MPVDSRNKRAGCVGMDLVWKNVYPNPDGTIAQADRQQSSYKYPGILTASPSTATGMTYYRNLLGVGL